MKTKLLLTIFIILNISFLQSQTLSKFKGDNGKWGIKDETNNAIINPKYDYVFQDERSRFINVYMGNVDEKGKPLDGKWGLINKNGDEVIPLKYDGIRGCNIDTLFQVLSGTIDRDKRKRNGKVGVISISGDTIVPIKFDYIFEESEAYYREWESYFYVFIGDINTIFERQERSVTDRFGYFDLSGNEVVECKYNYIETNGPFVYIGEIDRYEPVSGKGKYASISPSGKLTSEMEFDWISTRSRNSDYIPVFKGVLDESGYPLKGKYSLVNSTTGEFKFHFKYDYLLQDNEMNIIFTYYGEIYDTVYNRPFYFPGKWGFNDVNTFTEVVPVIYTIDNPHFTHGKLKVKLDGEEFYINIKGERVD